MPHDSQGALEERHKGLMEGNLDCVLLENNQRAAGNNIPDVENDERLVVEDTGNEVDHDPTQQLTLENP